MEADADVETEGETEDLAPGQATPHLLRRIALEDPEVLLEHLAEWPVGDPVPVRETASGPAKRGRVLAGEDIEELSHQPRLADARLADNRHEMGLPLRDPAPQRRQQPVEL